jgi:hypothetical protein
MSPERCTIQVGSHRIAIAPDELREWARAGRIRPDDQILNNPETGWIRADRLPELKAFFPNQTESLIYEAFSQLSPFRWYSRTRRAVLAGRPLYDYSLTKLQSEGLLAPLAFNFLESTLAATLAVFMWSVLVRFLPGSASAETGSPSDEILETILKVSLSATAPFVFLLIAYIAARASLRAPDQTAGRVERAVRAFLYLDGASGLAPQALLVLGLLTLAVAFDNPGYSLEAIIFGTTAGLVGGALIVVGLSWSAILLVAPITAKLFAVNGYPAGGRRWWPRVETAREGPHVKFLFGRLAGVGVLTLYLYLILILLSMVDVVVASLPDSL